jgi:hypothetical protein
VRAVVSVWLPEPVPSFPEVWSPPESPSPDPSDPLGPSVLSLPV